MQKMKYYDNDGVFYAVLIETTENGKTSKEEVCRCRDKAETLRGFAHMRKSAFFHKLNYWRSFPGQLVRDYAKHQCQIITDTPERVVIKTPVGMVEASVVSYKQYSFNINKFYKHNGGEL